MLRLFAVAIAMFAWLTPSLCSAEGTDKTDHYEVTIAPPTRPGKQPAAPPTVAPDTAAPTAVAPEAKAAPGEASQPPASTKSATAAAAPTGPMRTLQVGAYRQRRSAEEMSARLGDAFGEVQVIEIDSGGEKLYRVRVGRMPAGPALSELKSRLLAAGYPAFEVEISEPR